MKHLLNIFITVILLHCNAVINAQRLNMGFGNVLYICPDSTITAVGYNHLDSTETNNSIPRKVKGLHDVVSVDATGQMALLKDSTVWTWVWYKYNGSYYYDTYYKLAPFPIDSVKAIGFGFEEFGTYYCFVRTDGSLWVKGYRWESPAACVWAFPDTIKKIDVPKVKSISCTRGAFIVLCEDSSVWMCGTQYIDGNGNDTAFLSSDSVYFSAYRTKPWKLNSLSGITQVAISNITAYALRDDGTLWGWGYIINNPPKPRHSIPVRYNISNVKSFFVSHAGESPEEQYLTLYAIKDDSTLWYWGPGMKYTDAPKQVTGLPKVLYGSSTTYGFNSPPYGTLEPNKRSTYVYDVNGNLWRWGDNCYGELGNFTTFPVDTPEMMPHPCVAVDCDTFVKNPDVLKLDTAIFPVKPVKLKSS